MEKKDLNMLYCANCGSSDVEMTMWVNPNTGERGCYIPDRLEDETC